MDYSRVVLGIGNPGEEYADTRHNLGFMVLDRVASEMGLTFRRLERRAPDGRRLFGGKVKAKVAQASGPELLVKPLTYVNLSGDVAGALLRVAELSPEALFVVVDDLNLPLGRIRVRPSGSAGGHNGLKSIEDAIGTSEYPRLRLGIGPSDGSPSTDDGGSRDYVLARFLPEEREVLDAVIERGAAIVREWLAGDSPADLMGRHNGFRALSEESSTAEDESSEDTNPPDEPLA
ncbi:MAG: aminoacyl-tRNA hydrolase [Planctomycetota bacterium]|jgi:PTH1 family peptidyl-tRNA hydrolase